MKKRGRYERAKKSGGGWKVFFVILLVLVILVAILAVGANYFIDSKLGKITQARFEDRGTTAELDAMAGVMQSTAPSTTPSEPVNPEQIPDTQMETAPAVTVETVPVQTTMEPEIELTTTAGPADYGQSGKIVNIMVVGQDYREIEAHKLADTIMLFTLNKETHQLTVTSFLRDSYINLPDYYRGHTCGWNRINTAYALGYGWFGDAGAMDMLNVTIQNNFGVEVDGNVEISLDSFMEIVDQIGGIELYIEGDELTYMNKEIEDYMAIGYELHHLIEGENHLNGREALMYAMMRHANASDSDINRAARQRLIIDKVLGKLKQMSLLELNELLDTVLPCIVTNISTDDMKMYIKELLPYVFDVELVSNQCPAEGTYWGEWVELPDGMSTVLKMDFNKNRALLMAICEDN